MAEPIPTGTPVCTNLGTDLSTYWDCMVNVVFLNDFIIMGMVFLIMLGIMGFGLRLPMPVMFVFGFAMVFSMFVVFDIQVLLPILSLGALALAALVLVVIFRVVRNAAN
ncbi:hypothetical protein LCGC14_0464400 [marine sediment metagenome]|uniref:Uncharacterized protein n=1 Tax=marine sediment metagenome TaxID=412755 RepID=A0A0F9VMR6_9ZZZZ